MLTKLTKAVMAAAWGVHAEKSSAAVLEASFCAVHKRLFFVSCQTPIIAKNCLTNYEEREEEEKREKKNGDERFNES